MTSDFCGADYSWTSETRGGHTFVTLAQSNHPNFKEKTDLSVPHCFIQRKMNDTAVSLPTPRLYLNDISGKGRGVFCHEHIPARTLIHISPVLIMKDQDADLSQKTILREYTYNWGADHAVALGLGSMFNHSNKNNVGFIKRKDRNIIEYYTLEEVEAETELCIHYGPHLWFDDANEQISSGEEKINTDAEEFDLLKVFAFDDENNANSVRDEQQ